MKDKKNYVGIVAFCLLIVLLVIVIFLNFSDKNSTTVLAEYESKQLSLFNSDFKKQMEYVKNNNMTSEEGTYYLNGWLNENVGNYDSKSVDLISVELSDTLFNKHDNLNGLMNKLENGLGEFNISESINKLLGVSGVTRTISIRSNTVCQTVLDSKYCVNKLSANVYVTDANSSKWVVLVHPFMTSGSLIYNSLGDMYEKQGYNIIAPDLRGFGNSDGSVAMGYLESLDIYDWIKDLNTNWNDANRYGVNVEPSTIIVHGISLGGATTLQLATNPDIAAANGNEPYTKNLTQLNVIGFVDDCGYTSMSGVITGMLNGGNINQISSLLSSFDVSEYDFMSTVQDTFKQYGITGFDFDFNNLKGGYKNGKVTDKISSYKEFIKQYDYLDDVLSGILNEGNNNVLENKNKNNPYLNGTFDLGNLDLPKLEKQYGGDYDIPRVEDYRDYLSDLKDKFGKYQNKYDMHFQSNVQNNNSLTQINKSMSVKSSNVLNSLIGTVLMKTVGVGLTEENYAKYSDVFSSNRKFPAGSKVMIVHGTADIMVPFENANIVANNVEPGTLVKKWEVSDSPHAFVIIGLKTNDYDSMVSKFVSCVENTNCTTFN